MIKWRPLKHRKCARLYGIDVPAWYRTRSLNWIHNLSALKKANNIGVCDFDDTLCEYDEEDLGKINFKEPTVNFLKTQFSNKHIDALLIITNQKTLKCGNKQKLKRELIFNKIQKCVVDFKITNDEHEELPIAWLICTNLLKPRVDRDLRALAFKFKFMIGDADGSERAYKQSNFDRQFAIACNTNFISVFNLI